MSQTRPDAVIVPRSLMTGGNGDEQKESIIEIAEKLLECGPFELAWCHDQESYFFCTRKAEDTEKHPLWHPQYGKPRYNWMPGSNGTKLGYLMSGTE